MILPYCFNQCAGCKVSVTRMQKQPLKRTSARNSTKPPTAWWGSFQFPKGVRWWPLVCGIRLWWLARVIWETIFICVKACLVSKASLQKSGRLPWVKFHVSKTRKTSNPRGRSNIINTKYIICCLASHNWQLPVTHFRVQALGLEIFVEQAKPWSLM